MSGRRDSNPRPLAWKANALSTELLPHSLFKQKCRAILQNFLNSKQNNIPPFKAIDCFKKSVKKCRIMQTNNLIFIQLL